MGQKFLNALLIPVTLFAVSCASGGGSTTTNPSLVSVTVVPSAANVVVGTPKQFSDTVSGTSNKAVTWSVSGGGTISAAGLYTAPSSVPNPATATVKATSQADATKFSTATVTILAAASTVQVSVQPAVVSVSNFRQQQFTATVTGNANTAVTWQVNGVAGGSKKLGFISANGLYVAPSGVPTQSDGQGNTVTTTVTVTAVSQADATGKGNATVTLLPNNANTQGGPVQLGTTGSNAKDFVSGTKTITCCGGTLGSLVTRGGTQYILSNNHVLARSDAATLGDAIVQPGLIDTATCTADSTLTVANLSQFFNLQTSPTPNIDAAIAQVVAGKVDPAGNIIYLGSTVDSNGVPTSGAPLAGTGITVAPNRAVAKSGRSTGLTCSTVEATNINTNVSYTQNCDGTGTTFAVNYSNQIGVLGGDFSAEGDSGSLIVTQDTATPVALLYAGSDTDSVGNPVGDVLNFFKSGSNTVSFVGGGAHQVIGCSLPNAPQSAKNVVPTSLEASVLQRAVATRDLHAPELLAHPEVQAVGVGGSYDNPREPAILFFVTQGQTRTNLPAQIDGIRTRVVEGPLFSRRGSVSAEESGMLEKSAEAPQLVYSVNDLELSRAKTVHAAHAGDLMKQAGVQGVGVGSSVDSPGEAALMIFVIRGVPHDPIPAVIDGLRTRVRESSRFRAGTVGAQVQRACKLPGGKNGGANDLTSKSAAAKTVATEKVAP